MNTCCFIPQRKQFCSWKKSLLSLVVALRSEEEGESTIMIQRGCRRASSAFEWLFNHLKWSFTNYSETIRSFKRRIWGSFFQQVMSWNPKISIQFVVDVLFAQLKSIIAWINSGLSMPAAPHWRWMHEEIQRLRETKIKYNQKRDLPPWQDLEVIWSRVGGFPLSTVRL